MRKLIYFTLALWMSASAAADVCTPAPVKVDDVLTSLQQTWVRAENLAPGWRVDVARSRPGGFWASLISDLEANSRSSWEIYSRTANLIYLTGSSRDAGLIRLTEAANVGTTLLNDWNRETYARFAEAAILRGTAVYPAMDLMRGLRVSLKVATEARTDWEIRDFARIATTAYVMADSTDQAGLERALAHAVEMTAQINSIGELPAWFHRDLEGRPSMLIEAAMIGRTSVEEAYLRLSDLHAILAGSGVSLDSVDYYLLLRAALKTGMRSIDVANLYVAVVSASHDLQWGWGSRDYVKVTAALMVSGRTEIPSDPKAPSGAKLAAAALRDALQNQKLAPNWANADYSAAAETALLATVNGCRDLNRLW